MDPNATYYGDAQRLYQDLVAHYTQGLSRRQCLELLEKNLDELRLDKKWDKTTEAFLNMVDNRLKDHKGIAPDPAQYPKSWYVTRLNWTLETHTTLYQYIIINHQMQADSIASHLGTTSATVTSYKTHVEIICTFCQTIDHSNRKALQETNRRKALKVEQTTGCGGGRGRSQGSSDRRGRSPG